MNTVELLRKAAKSLKKTPTSDHLEMQLEAAADELEKAEAVLWQYRLSSNGVWRTKGPYDRREGFEKWGFETRDLYAIPLAPQRPIATRVQPSAENPRKAMPEESKAHEPQTVSLKGYGRQEQTQ